MKKHLALTAALTLALIGGGTSAAFADDTTPSEVTPSASTATPGDSQPAPDTSSETSDPSAQPSAPATTPVAETTEPTPTPSDTPVASPEPSSAPVVPAPVTTTAPAPEPEPAVTTPAEPEPVDYVTVLWQMPGAETTWPQKYIDQVEGSDVHVWSPVGLQCGTSYQVDVYPADAVPTLTADGILEQGEDSKVVLDYDTFTTDDCIAVTPLTPTIQVHCNPAGGGYQDVVLPEQEGVKYTTEEPGMNAIVVTATAREGFVLTGTTSWRFSKMIVNEDSVCPTPTPPAATPPSKPSASVGDVNIQPAVDRSTTPAVAATAPDSLAFTGSNTDRFIEWTLLLLSLGAICFAIGKRPRREGKE